MKEKRKGKRETVRLLRDKKRLSRKQISWREKQGTAVRSIEAAKTDTDRDIQRRLFIHINICAHRQVSSRPGGHSRGHVLSAKRGVNSRTRMKLIESDSPGITQLSLQSTHPFAGQMRPCQCSVLFVLLCCKPKLRPRAKQFGSGVMKPEIENRT